jgi:hypothetical protein
MDLSKYIITDLRDLYGTMGVVCTDWLITGEGAKRMFFGKIGVLKCGRKTL